jgi:hypothetical protein
METGFYIDSMKRRMLPMSLGVQSPSGVLTQNVQPGQATQATPSLPRSMEIRRKIAELEGSQAEDDGGMSTLNALAAQFAGESFAPIQAQYLKRASASSPQARTQAQLARLMREAEIADRQEGQQALQAERLAAQQQAEAERRAAAAERAAQSDQLRRELAGQRDETMRFLAGQSAQLRRDLAGNRTPAAGLAPTGAAPVTPSAPAAPLIVTPDINPSAAMGAEGKVRSTWNKIGDALNAGNPNEANRMATAQLNALSSKTRAVLQDAFGGRPSNMQLQLIQPLLIQPNELFTGSGTAQTRVQALKGMITEGINSQQAVLSAPNVSKAQQTRALQKLQELQQLNAEYDALGRAFPQQQQAAPASAGGSYSDAEKERRYQEWKARQQK